MELKGRWIIRVENGERMATCNEKKDGRGSERKERIIKVENGERMATFNKKEDGRGLEGKECIGKDSRITIAGCKQCLPAFRLINDLMVHVLSSPSPHFSLPVFFHEPMDV